MKEDPFSDVLALANARSVVSGGFLAGGDWAIRFPPPDRVKFFIAARGACWLSIEGEESIRFSAGETILLTAARGFTLASDPALPALDAVALYGDDGNRIINLGTAEEFFFLGGHVRLDSASGNLLIDNLPPVIHLRAGSVDADAIRWLIDRLAREHHIGLPGSDFAATQLAQLVFLQILRAYLASTDTMTAGRLRAISDPRIAPAIRMMHADPARAWHLTELARACAMSRTVFASYFKSVAGLAPLTYLTQWRMHLAERALRESNAPLSELSEMLGYSSESAFSVAFKRVTGKAPKRYRSAARRAVSRDLVLPRAH
ncbi:AraC family transcriptional regulator [Pseudothauera rhizosphaerae]|uniref:AraC family transcriptional regulator n=1 Tax=Pseudothauera rhizosphaerae TaxID=2565932 RepID=A0A4S4AC51_9RHOO|nr:AraC family transcriptional regulator [Pseudothauera rhizosphaerae]THF56535.1 AraC family transcriptional regulator [Pseudothauera rhizosphaerae]